MTDEEINDLAREYADRITPPTPTDSFPSVTWHSEPKRVKIEITPIDE